MGQAKLRKALTPPTIYHHTSTLRTNLIWMSGVIELEGRGQTPVHPQLGDIDHAAMLRRPFRDFPPLAWFTRKIDVPRCLSGAAVILRDRKTGEELQRIDDPKISHGMALNRVALGFRLSDAVFIPWPQHPGYTTPEGCDLNESAHEFGDDPDDWFVSERPVDVALASEFWASKSILNPKLERFPNQLKHIRKMVHLCRTQEGVVIPPSWLSVKQAQALAARISVPIGNPEDIF